MFFDYVQIVTEEIHFSTDKNKKEIIKKSNSKLKAKYIIK